MRFDKLQQNNKYWENLKKQIEKESIIKIENAYLRYKGREQYIDNRVMKYMTFGGFIKFALQIYYNYKRFFKSSASTKRSKYYSKPRMRSKESKTNLNMSSYRFNLKSESNESDGKTISDPIKSNKKDALQPSLFKRNSTKPSDEVVKNKLQEVQPKKLRIATMGVMNANKYSNKSRLKNHKYYIKEENDKSKENFDNISGISTKNENNLNKESLSSKVSVSSLGSSLGAKGNKADVSIADKQNAKELEIATNEPNMIISPHHYLSKNK